MRTLNSSPCRVPYSSFEAVTCGTSQRSSLLIGCYQQWESETSMLIVRSPNHRTEAIVLVGINILSCFLGTIGNLLVFMTVFNTPAMKQSSFHYFVSSLAMSDLINALVTQPLLAVLIAGRASSLCLPVIHCTFRWICNIGFGTSHLTLLLISLDRCLTVSETRNIVRSTTKFVQKFLVESLGKNWLEN
ncbi:uncharacterized protein LOC141875987 isoform X3 [Acropora palmata]|uniref:uncharacterized protein LOC141875987 isoform X3 n=1 Tax=Acropora palmata TaxID=6131 RepID=UPI003DA0EA1C